MTNFLNQKEREWYASHATYISPKMSLTEVKRVFYLNNTSYPSVSVVKVGLDELEDAWLLQYIKDNSGVVPSDDDKNSFWREMARLAGQTPSKYLNENKLNFFANAS